MKKFIFLFFLSVALKTLQAQCPTVSCASSFSITSCQSGQTLAAVASYSANISSSWLGPGNIPIASVGTATSIVKLNASGIYTVAFTDNLSNCMVTNTVQVFTAAQKPTFTLATSGFNLLCNSSIVTVSGLNAAAGPSNMGGPVSFTLMGPVTSSTISQGALSTQANYSINTCGNWEMIVLDNTNFCYSSYIFPVTCPSISATPLNITGANTVCLGSSVTFSSNGTNNIWNNAATGATINSIPSASSVYSVNGNDANNCPSSGSIAVTVFTTCADVWPGDANSDGIVDNFDVLELGLAFGSIGPARSATSIAYASQYASAWNGTVSTGKNLCHADCDGDGLVGASDNLAVSANFMIPHAFKPSASSGISNAPQTSIIAPPIANAGLWNRAELYVGDSGSAMSGLYGLCFDINFDAGVIEPDSIYLSYTPSFLNAGNQTIDLSKTVFNSGKLYAASVRTDGSNVSGTGKIADIYFKLKYALPQNSTLTLSLSNTTKVDHSGLRALLSAGTASMLIDANSVGLEENKLSGSGFSVYPNPANTQITLLSNADTPVDFIISDLNGKALLNGSFNTAHTLDLEMLENGTYFVHYRNNERSCYKKLIINR